MRISTNNWMDKLVWLLTVFFIASFVLFGAETWGKYIYLGFSVLIALLAAVNNGGKLRLCIVPYVIWAVCFVAFSYLSVLCAKYSESVALTKASTLLQVAGVFYLIYIYYQDKKDIHPLLTAVMWAGYIIAAYTLIVNGYDAITEMASEDNLRMENEFANVNTIGMFAAYSCVFQFHELMGKRKPWTAVMMIPAILVIAATQSRKAMILLLGGIMAVYIVRNLQNRDRIKNFLKIIAGIAVAVLAIQMLMELPVFGGIQERMEKMLAGMLGQEGADNSTLVRIQMRNLGWEIFLQNPIFGIGLDNARYVSWEQLGHYTYLHNNYAELLATGGLVGFALYYSAHIYVLTRYFKYRKADREAFSVGLVWLGAMLVLDYGLVSYYDKVQWIYLLTHFLNVEYMKRKYEEQQYELQKTVESGN